MDDPKKPFSYPELPTELWIDVFTHLQHLDRVAALDAFHSGAKPAKHKSKNQTLISVNSTCRAFHALVRPLLYEKLSFCGNTDRALEKSRRLADALLEDIQLRNWPKEVIVDRWIPSIAERDPSLLSPVFERISQAWPLLTNLRKLHVNHTTLTRSMYTHIFRFPNLREFVCWNISIFDETQDHDPPIPINYAAEVNPASLSITHLTFYNMHIASNKPNVIDAIARLALSPSLQFLHLSQFLSAPVFACSRLQQHVFTELETLELFERIEERNIDEFFRFLTYCPSLSTLRVASAQETPRKEMVPAACPSLRSFVGGIAIAELAVKGRPVDSIRCFAPRGSLLSASMLTPLTKGTVPLRNLELSPVVWDDNSFEAIAEAFPELESLSVWYENLDIMPWIKTYLSDQIKALPRLWKLDLCGSEVTLMDDDVLLSHPNRASEKEVLRRVEAVCPSLQQATLQAGEVVWSREVTAGAEWICRKR